MLKFIGSFLLMLGLSISSVSAYDVKDPENTILSDFYVSLSGGHKMVSCC